MKKAGPEKRSPKDWLMEHGLDVLLIFIPIAPVLHYTHATETLVFIASGLAIVPLAGWMGKATEALAEKLGAGIGGLLNATFGNAPELIIALFAVRDGLTEVVRGSLTGSVVGNLLLVLGFSLLFGQGDRSVDQKSSFVWLGLVLVATLALLVPAIPSWDGEWGEPDAVASKRSTTRTQQRAACCRCTRRS